MKTVCKKRKRDGFTLIEILVVLGIIVLLAAILFPVFARVRENARRAACASNLSQIGLAVAQYRQDNENTLPFVSYAQTQPADAIYSGGQFTWMHAILPYTKNEQIFDCPSYPKPGKKFTDGPTNWHGYGMAASAYYYDRIGINDWGGGWIVNGVPMDLIFKPSETIYAVGDSTSHDAAGVSWGVGDNVDMRHNGHANFLFMDGHVKSLTVAETSEGPYDQTSGNVDQDGIARGYDYLSTGVTSAMTCKSCTWSYWDNGPNT